MAAQTPQRNTKESLRSIFLAKRQTLTEDELEKMNQGLLTQLKKLDLRGILDPGGVPGPERSLFPQGNPNPQGDLNPDKTKTLSIFLSIRRQAEPDTYRLVDWINQRYPTVRWAVGRTVRKTSGMYHFEWNESSLIRENKWGIPEPLGGVRVGEKEIDLIFVPLLVIDRSGHRIGYGKGYYDRFLAKCRPNALKIGISLFEPVERIADPCPTDIPLNACITPQATYWFGE